MMQHFSVVPADQPEKLILILDINSISLDDNPMPETPFALKPEGATATEPIGLNHISILIAILSSKRRSSRWFKHSFRSAPD